MKKQSKDILTKGLKEGYVGNSVMGSSVRAGFKVVTSDYEGKEGKYHDEWMADFNGGGQELTRAASGDVATRVYGGGTLAKEELKKLGLSKKDVIGKLITFVNKLGSKTRLDEESKAKEGPWEYTYKVIKSEKTIPVDVGEEKIEYKGKLVFIHYHIISPVI